jgi:hypothetical protein
MTIQTKAETAPCLEAQKAAWSAPQIDIVTVTEAEAGTFNPSDPQFAS